MTKLPLHFTWPAWIPLVVAMSSCSESDKSPPKTSGPPVDPPTTSSTGAATGGAGGEGGQAPTNLCMCAAALCPAAGCFSAENVGCTECADLADCSNEKSTCTTTPLCWGNAVGTVKYCLEGCNGDAACLAQCTVKVACEQDEASLSKDAWVAWLKCVCAPCAGACALPEEPMCPGTGGAGGTGGASGGGQGGAGGTGGC